MPTLLDMKKGQSNSLLHSKFFYLLCSLILYFSGTALFKGNMITNYINSALFSFLILVCIYPFLQSKKIKYCVILIGLFIMLTHWVSLFYEHGSYVYVILYLSCTIFLLLVTHSVIHSIVEHKEITINSLFGAVCGYFLLGFTWTFLYLLINALSTQAFSPSIEHGSIHEMTQHFFYFSFTTMTTLGYGDVLPLSDFARTCSWLEALTGQIYLAVWISQLVGLRITQEMKKRIDAAKS